VWITNGRVKFYAARKRGEVREFSAPTVWCNVVTDAMRGVHDSAEAMASLLDGTASAAEREALMRRMAASPELHAAFVEAMAIRKALYPDVAVPPDAAARTDVAARSRRRRVVAACALLAACLGVVAYLRMAQPRPQRDVLDLAQGMQLHDATGAGSVSRALGPEWDAPTWAVVRGDANAREQVARAFRAGVRVAQLSAAANASDAPAVTTAVEHLRDLLAGSAGSAPLAMQLSDLAGTSGSVDARARNVLLANVRTVLGDPDWFNLGVWIETARMAALNQQAAFFAPGGAAAVELALLLRRMPEPRERWSSATLPLRDVSLHVSSGNMPALVAVLHAVAMRAGS
jgi:hypothetical protein